LELGKLFIKRPLEMSVILAKQKENSYILFMLSSGRLSAISFGIPLSIILLSTMYVSF
jgi:hypothetical protein